MSRSVVGGYLRKCPPRLSPDVSCVFFSGVSLGSRLEDLSSAFFSQVVLRGRLERPHPRLSPLADAHIFVLAYLRCLHLASRALSFISYGPFVCNLYSYRTQCICWSHLLCCMGGWLPTPLVHQQPAQQSTSYDPPPPLLLPTYSTRSIPALSRLLICLVPCVRRSITACPRCYPSVMSLQRHPFQVVKNTVFLRTKKLCPHAPRPPPLPILALPSSFLRLALFLCLSRHIHFRQVSVPRDGAPEPDHPHVKGVGR